MIEILERVWQNLIERTEGPLNLRFFLQPSMAIFFAVRSGLRDARQGNIPFLWRWATSAGNRKAIAKEGWKDYGKVFILATILDIIYQLIVIYGLKTEVWFYPLESLIVATLLSFIPYIFVRGPIRRLISLFVRKKQEEV